MGSETERTEDVAGAQGAAAKQQRPRGGDVRAAAAAELEGSGFATRAEVDAWLAFVDWQRDPDRDHSLYVELPDCGWVPGDAVELHTGRKRSTLAAATPSSAPRLLTLQEASAAVRTPSETIRYWIYQGRLTAFKPGRAVLVLESELLELVRSRETRRLRALNTGRVNTRRVVSKRPRT